jgi:hypothetical protein
MKRSTFLFLSWPIDDLGWSMMPDSFSFFYSLLLRVTSSPREYLLAIANISFDVLGFFMVSLQSKDEPLSPFLKNMIMDLSSTSGVMFLLLQKCWMNSQRDSPFFWTMLARSQSTLGRVHVVQKLLVNIWHRWDQECTEPEESPRSHILADDRLSSNSP